MSFFLIFVCGWFLSFVVLRVLVIWFGQSIVRFLEKKNLKISLFSISWHSPKISQAINRSLQKNTLVRNLLNKWYFLGSIFTVLLMITSLVLWLVNIWKMLSFFFSENKQEMDQILKPIIPGVNVPLSHFWFLLISLVINGVFHELGHAIASVSAGQVKKLSSTQQLKVYSAGVWNNCLIIFFAIFLILVLPKTLLLFYNTNQGIIVISNDLQSPFNEDLKVGDSISMINSCKIKNSIDFVYCLSEIQIQYDDPTQTKGYCINSTLINLSLDKNGLYCCKNDPSIDQSKIHCFELFGDLNNNNYDHNRICISPLQVLSSKICYSKGDCNRNHNLGIQNECYFEAQQPGKVLLKIQTNENKEFIYFGSLTEFYQLVEFGEYVDKFGIGKIIPLFFKIPSLIDLFITYLLTISGGLIVINVTPCYFSDGGHIIKTLIGKVTKSSKAESFSKFLMAFGTCLIVINIILSLYGLKFSKNIV
ncbi:protease m50 membrane-bound transcription factor site 2 protease [Anaeramoeba flamelloides]|uniref:Endopeptidase S2P n=1 Tax=Anaeramoeba flamelloides TaxID=1746091 RepID=A0AAV8ACG5_9EUKA|nr:protease m50 membrane-bound transcription factor site 2 protease [Anaeramoeba flamelloides]